MHRILTNFTIVWPCIVTNFKIVWPCIVNFTIVWPCIVTNSLWMKPLDALNSKFIGITTLHVSSSFSAHHQDFLAVHRHWYIFYSFDDRLLPGAGWKQFHLTPGSKRSSNLHKIYQCRCRPKNSWWWAERLPETSRVIIPINLEFSASVGFIHKEFVSVMFALTVTGIQKM